MADIGMAAFSMFLMQYPSFLSFQRLLRKNTGKDNTQTLFGMGRIPTDNHIRQTLDGIDPDMLEAAYFHIVDSVAELVPSAVRNVLDGHTLIALDGSEYFCSKNVKCASCSNRLRNDGELEYFHSFMGATIVTPASKTVLSLPPEFVRPPGWCIEARLRMESVPALA